VSPLIAPPGEPGLIEARAGAVPVEVAGNGARTRAARAAAAAAAHDRPSRRDQLRRINDLAISMARAEFKLRYLDSAIGYVWALGQPLLMYAVLYTVWTNVIHRGDDVAHYPLKLLLAIVLFTFFSEATGSALPSLLSKGTMLRKIPFPPLVVPLSTLITTGFAYGLSLLIVFGFILGSGIEPSTAWLQLFPILALLIVFTAGVGLVLSLSYVVMRDIQPMWVVVSRLLFFVTPVFYPVGIASGSIQHALMLNPLAVVIEQARHALIDPSAPTAAQAAGGTARLAVPIVFSIALFVVGVALYRTRAQRLVERI
jgi:ABC-2 type transport system permease protein